MDYQMVENVKSAVLRWYETNRERYIRTWASTEAARALDEPLIRLQGQRVLEVGCGTGRLLQKLKGRRLVLGLDISRNMLEVAKEKGFSVILGDAEHLPLRSGSLDCILSGLGSLSHTNLEASLSETGRVLADGGRFGITVLNSRAIVVVVCLVLFLNLELAQWLVRGLGSSGKQVIYRFYSPAQLKRQCKRLGLNVIAVRSVLWLFPLIPSVLHGGPLTGFLTKISGLHFEGGRLSGEVGFFLLVTGQKATKPSGGCSGHKDKSRWNHSLQGER